MSGDLILEAGCGAGRFTRLMGETGARLVAFDYSSAVDACAENNAHLDNVAFLQCDIFDLPFEKGRFDRVFCHGVLQHTPNPEAAFHELTKMLRPGGKISIDVYLKDWTIQTWKSKYLWRPITTRMDQAKLLRFLERFIPLWLPIETVIKRIRILDRFLGSIIPCWNYFYTDLSKEQKVQWAIMDTFAALSPAFDKPASVRSVKRWFRDAGLHEVIVRKGGNGVVGNGTRPVSG
jgi:SAM-dependent methyltransferase